VATTAEQIRTFKGPALLSYGFRPFFLAGAAWAAIAVAVWLPMLSGHLTLPTALAPLDWHVHELVYGYVPAVMAGFLLTAVPNWTGRLPVTGAPLLGLFLIWAAGRVAILLSGWIGAGAAAAVDLSFLAALWLVIGREIVAGRNARNLKVLAVVGLLLTGNVAFHTEALYAVGQGYGTRLGIGAIITLIMIIGGRIVPSFTRNWLVRRGPGRLPVPFNRFDAAVIIVSVAALASWIARPDHAATAALALAAGLLNLLRLARWAGQRTGGEPLVLVLHTGYLFVPLGFMLLALGIVAPHLILASGAVHSWTAGAIGLMTLAVMTRASLGHTGHPLTATVPVRLIYLAAVVAAVARIVAAIGYAREPMLHVSAAAWIAAFAGFVIIYAPLLAGRPRVLR
jgi:uncharacterized protein involved in response to NO